MWRIIFKFHLVPLVLGELFVCRKYTKIWPKWWQIWTYGASGRGRRPWAHLGRPPSPTRVLPDPLGGHATSLINGSCSKANHKLPFKSVWSTDKICSRWIHGPIVIDLGASIDLPTTIPTKFHHALASQLTWRSNQHPWMQRRCIQRLTGAPMPPPGAPWWPPTSLLPTNTLYASLHYK
jgi:hypothetical protein